MVPCNIPRTEKTWEIRIVHSRWFGLNLRLIWTQFESWFECQQVSGTPKSTLIVRSIWAHFELIWTHCAIRHLNTLDPTPGLGVEVGNITSTKCDTCQIELAVVNSELNYFPQFCKLWGTLSTYYDSCTDCNISYLLILISIVGSTRNKWWQMMRRCLSSIPNMLSKVMIVRYHASCVSQVDM